MTTKTKKTAAQLLPPELAEIGLRIFGLETLEERRSDRLDFHDTHVGDIVDALREAYELGLATGRAEPPRQG